jgi:hypothetical protein
MKMGRRRSSGAAGRMGRTGLAGWLGLAGSMSLVGWAGRKWRGMRPDRNLLRRRWDRIEAFIFGGLLVVAAAGAPVVAMAASHWAYTSAHQAARLQREASSPVPADLLAVPGTTPSAVTTMVMARAQWTAPAGATRTGAIPVRAGSVRGDVVTIWTDQAGDLVNAPMTPAQVADQGTFGLVAGIALTVVTLLVAAGVTRILVNRRRMAAWDADWAVTAPMWTRQR